MSRKPEQNIVILGCRKEPLPWVLRSKTSVDIEPPKIKATISDGCDIRSKVEDNHAYSEKPLRSPSEYVNSHITKSPEIFQKRISLVKTNYRQVKFDENSGDSESSPKLNPPFLSGIIKSRKTSPEKLVVGGYASQKPPYQSTDSPIKKFTEFITSWFTQKSKNTIDISEKNALYTSASIQEYQKSSIYEYKISENNSNYIFSTRNEKPKNVVIIPFEQK